MKFVRIGPYDGPLFDRYVQKNPAFVKFYSPNCFHCTNMAPAWDGLEKTYGARCSTQCDYYRGT